MSTQSKADNFNVLPAPEGPAFLPQQCDDLMRNSLSATCTRQQKFFIPIETTIKDKQQIYCAVPGVGRYKVIEPPPRTALTIF